MILIRDILKPRNEVIEGKFQGVIQSHKADSKEKRLESNARVLFKITYVSSALKRAIERIDEKLKGVSNQGAFLLVGPYGSGKTHGLITLYHLLREPQSAKEWLRDWRIEVALPSSTKTLKRRLEHLNIFLHLLQMIKITLIY